MRASVINALEVCPVEVAISAVGGAWKLTIVKHLLTGTLRFGELRRAVGPVSERTLARQLRELETDGLVHREVYAEVPPRVEYSLTPLGESLREVVAAMDAWGSTLGEQIGAAGANDADRTA
ncbi:helix-turn-helix transcriptional regulator [Ruania alkalisoli]|uniref:Helix-turn-helix transcriptional regulator n=1 Tax=Ruania alkalisoli TaxID=2779775 RepID=A0A7M1SUL8_9MICO|nr:helix-turn-helix domain-containing protein [Ruania alkalisoli]QOR70313.1 helix-turn-helix transcriptional regulator [Ruania alkalisoli]